MTTSSFPCPQCRTPLRVRDDERAETAQQCPECGAPLVVRETEQRATESSRVVAEGGRDPRGEAVDAASILDAAPAVNEPVVPRFAAARDYGTRWGNRLRSPVVIAWTTAAVAGLALLVALVTNRRPRTVDASAADSGDSSFESSNDVLSPPVDLVRDRLTSLADRLASFRERHDRLPIGGDAELPPETRLSWLARLEAFDVEGVAAPDWNRAFDDPRNAEFVQRVRPRLLNPGIPDTKSPAGYPTTHFVGVGGVGADAPDEPAGSSRAGMFGNGRSASVEDVVDGLSNTVMVAGVTSSLGPWAAGGPGTVRPFTAEPYVNGPDGFGSGDPKGMLVLMGDGSVRSIAVDVDPRVVRRMAAMADGLDLGLEQDGEPGDRAPPSAPPPLDVAVVDPPLAEDPMPKPAAEPGDPAAPEIPNPDIPNIVLPALPAWTNDLVREKLRQRLSGFRTSQPVVAEALLEEVADLAGVPIHARVEDGVDLGVFDEPVSLTLEMCTVGDVLDALLTRLELRYSVAEDGLRLRPVEAPRDSGD